MSCGDPTDALCSNLLCSACCEMEACDCMCPTLSTLGSMHATRGSEVCNNPFSPLAPPSHLNTTTADITDAYDHVQFRVCPATRMLIDFRVLNTDVSYEHHADGSSESEYDPSDDYESDGLFSSESELSDAEYDSGYESEVWHGSDESDSDYNSDGASSQPNTVLSVEELDAALERSYNGYSHNLDAATGWTSHWTLDKLSDLPTDQVILIDSWLPRRSWQTILPTITTRMFRMFCRYHILPTMGTRFSNATRNTRPIGWNPPVRRYESDDDSEEKSNDEASDNDGSSEGDDDADEASSRSNQSCSDMPDHWRHDDHTDDGPSTQISDLGNQLELGPETLPGSLAKPKDDSQEVSRPTEPLGPRSRNASIGSITGTNGQILDLGNRQELCLENLPGGLAKHGDDSQEFLEQTEPLSPSSCIVPEIRKIGSRIIWPENLLFDSTQELSFGVASSFALASSEVVEPRETGKSHFLRHFEPNMCVPNASWGAQNDPMFFNAKSRDMKTKPKPLGTIMEDTDTSSEHPYGLAGPTLV